MLTIIEELLTVYQFSPEQIAGRLKMEGVVDISHTRIYQHIWQDREQGGDLYCHLRHRGKKYNRSGKGAGRGVIKNRIDIRERPEVVEEKNRVGDWEFDTMIGSKHCGVLVTLVERGSKFVLMQKVKRKTAQEVSGAIKKKLKPNKDLCLTLTSDNGKEFADHEDVSKALGAGFYFAIPFIRGSEG